VPPAVGPAARGFEQPPGWALEVEPRLAVHSSPFPSQLQRSASATACQDVGSYAEVYAGLARKRRDGHLSERRYALACRQFERDWKAYVRVDLWDEILLLARDLIQRHPLRASDAIHLASALSLRGALGEDITFAAADERLLRAAGCRPQRLGRALFAPRSVSSTMVGKETKPWAHFV